MSWWTHIRGTVMASPMGRSQPEKRYILDTVLEHLPRVTGSEGDMDVHVIQRTGHDMSTSHDEFGMRTNNLTDPLYGGKSYKNGWHEVQTQYILVLDGDLRDRSFEETKRDLMKWLCRLAKRVTVYEILVELTGDYDRRMLISDDTYKFWNMHEDPSWVEDNKDHEPNWCEFMMWERGYNSDMPMKLMYKYYKDEKNDAEVERRMRWEDDDGA